MNEIEWKMKNRREEPDTAAGCIGFSKQTPKSETDDDEFYPDTFVKAEFGDDESNFKQKDSTNDGSETKVLLKIIEDVNDTLKYKQFLQKQKTLLFINSEETGMTFKFKDRKKFRRRSSSSGVNKDTNGVYSYALSFANREDPSMTCLFCNTKFNHMAEFLEHKKRYVDKTYWVCPEEGCKTRYKGTCEKRMLVAHINQHQGIFKYFCDLCEKGFPHKTSLKNHVEIHEAEGKERIKCDQCKQTHRTLTEMKYHKRYVHEKPVHMPCNICGKTFLKNIHSSEFKVHMESVHSETRKYECLHCEKEFKTRGVVLRHTRQVHEVEKNHNCTICGKAFFSNSKVKQHEIIHTGQRPFSCSKCGQEFVQKSNMQAHEKNCTSRF